MKFLSVKSANGKKVPITLFTDWDLLFCFPIFFWCVIKEFVLERLVGLANRIMVYPVSKVIGSKFKITKKKIAPLLVLSMATPLMLYAVHIFMPDMSGEYHAILTVVSLMLTLAVCEFLLALHNYQFPMHVNESLSKELISNEAEAISEYLVEHERTRGFLVTACMITIFSAYNLAFLFFLSGAGYFYLIPLFSVLKMAMFSDREFIEHISSHSRKGKCVRASSAKTLSDRLIVATNFVRVYLVWPLALWMPNFYFCTHTGIHHVENNGPADTQSSLRFDQTSFLSFVKAIGWFSVFQLIPVDQIRYHIALKRKKFLKTLITGFLMGVSVVCILAYFHPALMLVIVLWAGLGNGFSFHKFTHIWHGFHDATRPYSIEASNNSPIHFGHHKQGSVHIYFGAENARTFWRERESNPKKFPVFISGDMLRCYDRNWLLIAAMLWQKKIEVVDKLIVNDATNTEQLKKYVTGIRFFGSSNMVRRVDDVLSKRLGRFVENMLKKSLSKEDSDILYTNSRNTIYELRLMNFNRFKFNRFKFDPKDPNPGLPPGIY